MNCKICGESISTKDSFCEKCGAGVKEESVFSQGYSKKTDLSKGNNSLFTESIGTPFAIPDWQDVRKSFNLGPPGKLEIVLYINYLELIVLIVASAFSLDENIFIGLPFAFLSILYFTVIYQTQHLHKIARYILMVFTVIELLLSLFILKNILLTIIFLICGYVLAFKTPSTRPFLSRSVKNKNNIVN